MFGQIKQNNTTWIYSLVGIWLVFLSCQVVPNHSLDSLYLFAVPRGFPGGFLGVAWGFRGGCLGVSRGRPLLSPLQDPSNPQKTLSTHRTGWFFMPAFRTLFLNGMYHRACWNGIIILPIAISYFLDKKTNKMIKMNDPCRKRWGVCE